MVISQNLIVFMTMFGVPLLVFLWFYPGYKIRKAIRRAKAQRKAKKEWEQQRKYNPGIPPPSPFDTYDSAGEGEADKLKTKCACWVIFTVVILYLPGEAFFSNRPRILCYSHTGVDNEKVFDRYYTFGYVESFEGVQINQELENNIFVNKLNEPVIVREWIYDNDGNLLNVPPVTTILEPNQFITVINPPWLFGKNPPRKLGDNINWKYNSDGLISLSTTQYYRNGEPVVESSE